VAKACASSGVDVLNIHAGGRAAPGLDIYNGGKPKIAGLVNGASFGGTTGPWSRLLSNRFVAEVKLATSLPIIGGGGIFEWQHIVESIMYGSSLIQVCTSLMLKGFKEITKWLTALQDFMEQSAYPDVPSFCGIALKYICEPKDLQIVSVVAEVNEEKCNGCGSCANIGHCEAITIEAKKAHVRIEECIGCGTCTAICPKSAILMKSI